MRVFLLGAGASRAYHASPTGQKMPLARDFFNVFESLDIASNPWVLREGLVHYLSSYMKVDPIQYLESGIDIEELHSEIGSHFLRALDAEHLSDEHLMERLEVQRAYNELLFIFAATINSVQNGPISHAHASIAAAIGPEDVIITFNWDTLLDRALAAHGQWSVDSGYGIVPNSVFRDGWSSPSESIGKPLLLKLHGSTNWIVGYQLVLDNKIVLTQEAAADTLWVFESATRPYNCYAGRYMPGYEAFSYGYYPPNLLDRGRPAQEGKVIVSARLRVPWKPEGTAGDDGLTSMPLIIPPVKEKTYELYGGLFQTLWGRAEVALSNASQILVIGYSFPKTDHRSSKLFLDAFAKRSSIPEVIIVDPAPDRAKEKFVFEFGVPSDYVTAISKPFEKDFPLAELLEA
jgi:hypothetical protein